MRNSSGMMTGATETMAVTTMQAVVRNKQLEEDARRNLLLSIQR
jgi:hypothetical protein